MLQLRTYKLQQNPSENLVLIKVSPKCNFYVSPTPTPCAEGGAHVFPPVGSAVEQLETSVEINQ